MRTRIRQTIEYDPKNKLSRFHDKIRLNVQCRTRWLVPGTGKPKETQKGDRYLLYVGGQDQAYVGWGTIESNWRDGTRGWKSEEIVQTMDHMLREPVTGADVLAATGFKPPLEQQHSGGRCLKLRCQTRCAEHLHDQQLGTSIARQSAVRQKPYQMGRGTDL